MNQKAPPIDRRQLLEQAVTQSDAFTALRYLRHREVVPAIPEMEEKGGKVVPGFEACGLDLYNNLWQPEPEMKEKVPADRQYWASLLGQAMATSLWAETHASTQLSELKSVLGTIAMGESVLALVPEEDQQKLQELAEQQAEANQMSQQAQELQAQAQVAQMLADAAAGQAVSSQGQPQPSGSPQGQPGGLGQLTAEQARAIANELAREAAKASQDAKAARELADEAQLEAEVKAEELMGKPGSAEAKAKAEELRRIGLAALQQARQKVQEVSETLEAWGLEEAELSHQPIPESLTLVERMRKNEAFRKFQALLGRIRKIAARKARSKVAGEGARIAAPELGRDIRRADRSELVALTNPALRAKALRRWAAGELRLRGQKTKQKLGHGPVVVCEDASGSMDGAKQMWAKAVNLSAAHFAKLQRRSFGWVMFDSSVRKSGVYPEGRMSAEQMLELAESRAGGGTDFEKPLRKAIEMIQKEGLKKADILFLTDGECAVSDAFLAEFKAVKTSLEFNVIVVLMDVGSTSDATVKKFADRVERVSAFTAEEAETKVFSAL